MKDLTMPQSIIHPAIDPLSPKNLPLSEKTIEKHLTKFDIDRKKPTISQISRFDKWKDPTGVIKIFEMVREKTDCQLVLVGSMAPDDPEAQKILAETKETAKKSKHSKDIKIIVAGKSRLPDNDVLVNAVQTASDVVIQKSLKEGFGLTISEALYKETAVVASNVGGIPLQVIDGVNGFLHEPKDLKAFSNSILRLLKDEKLRKEFGINGKKHVKENFLITRLLSNYLELFNNIANQKTAKAQIAEEKFKKI